MSKSKEEKQNDELFLQKAEKVFCNLDVKKNKTLLLEPTNLTLLKALYVEKMSCVKDNQCTPTKYHEIPVMITDPTGHKTLVIEQQLCEKVRSDLKQQVIQQAFIVDDYLSKVTNDFQKTWKFVLQYFQRKQRDDEINGNMTLLAHAIFNESNQSFDKLTSLLIISEEEKSYEYLLHEYALNLAKIPYKIGFINLISYIDTYKMRFRNESEFENYQDVFLSADIVFLFNLDSLLSEDAVWINFYNLLKELLTRNKFLVVLSTLPLASLLVNLTVKKTADFGLLKKIFDLISNATKPK